MKDSQLFLFKMTFVLVCLLSILYFSLQALEKRENYSNIEKIANTFYKQENEKENMKEEKNNTPTERVKPQDAVSIQLDKSILNEIFGIDFSALLKKTNTANYVQPMNLNDYSAPNTDYCNFKNWIPKEAVRSLCPGCEPNKF